MTNFPSFLLNYPKKRPVLPKAYQDLYEQEYKINRGGGTVITRISMWLEEWMHRQAAHRQGLSTLEIGAGTFNHLRFEPKTTEYDVVEPFHALYSGNAEAISRVRRIYDSVFDIPLSAHYERILSIAVFEHLEDLPLQVAKTALHLTEDGILQIAYPSEGSFMWGTAWRCTTGISFRMRWGLSYKPFRKFEHVNTSREILQIIKYFFGHTSSSRFPFPSHHLSLYAYTEAARPRLDRCSEYLDFIFKTHA